MAAYPGLQTWVVDTFQPIAPLETDWVARTLAGIALFVCILPIGLTIDLLHLWHRHFVWTQILLLFFIVHYVDGLFGGQMNGGEGSDWGFLGVLALFLLMPAALESYFYLRFLNRTEEEEEEEEEEELEESVNA
jgi:hypothetical protein